MAYTIKIHTGDIYKVDRIRVKVLDRITKNGKFTCEAGGVSFDYSKPRGGSRKSGYSFRLNKIRLVKAKPYCGQHPGPCAVTNTKKPVGRWLEWDDWIKFNNLINSALKNIDADVWSEPHDVKGRFWIRKGLSKRVRYDWESNCSRGYEIREWNPGTPDQFDDWE